MNTILFTPKDTISDSDKLKLHDEGYIVIEVDDVSKIKTVSDLSLIGSDSIAVTAIEVLKGNHATSSILQDFGSRIAAKALAKIKS